MDMTQALNVMQAMTMVFAMMSMLSMMQAKCDRDYPTGAGWEH